MLEVLLYTVIVWATLLYVLPMTIMQCCKMWVMGTLLGRSCFLKFEERQKQS